jgi:hypothetical protein
MRSIGSVQIPSETFINSKKEFLSKKKKKKSELEVRLGSCGVWSWNSCLTFSSGHQKHHSIKDLKEDQKTSSKVKLKSIQSDTSINTKKKHPAKTKKKVRLGFPGSCYGSPPVGISLRCFASI